jgi:hypothetical protein
MACRFFPAAPNELESYFVDNAVFTSKFHPSSSRSEMAKNFHISDLRPHRCITCTNLKHLCADELYITVEHDDSASSPSHQPMQLQVLDIKGMWFGSNESASGKVFGWTASPRCHWSGEAILTSTWLWKMLLFRFERFLEKLRNLRYLPYR